MRARIPSVYVAFLLCFPWLHVACGTEEPDANGAVKEDGRIKDPSEKTDSDGGLATMPQDGGDAGRSPLPPQIQPHTSRSSFLVPGIETSIPPVDTAKVWPESLRALEGEVNERFSQHLGTHPLDDLAPTW